MKLKIPPVFVTFIFAMLMYVLTRFVPIGHFGFAGRTYAVYGLSLLAVVIMLVSVIQFFMSKTTVDPSNLNKTSKLVMNGIYKYSRNPMYLSLLLLLLAFAIWLGNAFNILIAAGFVSYMNKFQILPEEEALTKIFNKEYSQYSLLTRRWL